VLLKVLIKYNFYSNAHQFLAVAYKYLLCLLVTQIACERSFSTLKYIINRLRSKITNEYAFMVMSVEKKFR
jgi:hypothetical protein